MKNALDLYESNKSWYDYLPERKFIILDFFPNCKGRTLNVGVHEFNKSDELACPESSAYETIDINENCRSFGSSYKHTTVDFMDYEPEYKFDNIILFGVLGIPNSLGGYDYTLYKKESNLSEKINCLLAIGGKVLLGPDLSDYKDLEKNPYSTENFWKSFIENDEVFNENFRLETFFKGRNNLIIVLTKTS